MSKGNAPEDDAPAAAFLDNVQFWLRARSSSELARALDVSPALISCIRRGHRRITPDLVIRVARALEGAR
jgi:plasmid maintenance system antidote protein VapI